MVRNDSEAIVFLLDFTDKTSQEGLNQRFRLGARVFSEWITRRYGRHASLFHLRRRNEVALLSVHFEKPKPFRALNDPFRARRLGMQLLKLRQQRVILKHN